MKKVLFVCLGNICRSPLAEALFRRHVITNGLEFSCDSCGTAAYYIGAKPDSRSVANALENGLVYTHKARKISIQDFVNFNIIVVMDNSNLHDILKLTNADKIKIYKLRDFDPIQRGADVPDPYFGDDQGFQEVYEIIDRATLHLLKDLSES